MILLPDATEVVLDHKFNSDLIETQLRPLKPACADFLGSQACVWGTAKAIHVVQGEFAEVPLHSEDIGVIWSTDATTCLIAVALDRPTQRATICHHDQETVASLGRIIQLVDGMLAPELYIVGAFQDSHDIGKAILKPFLLELHALSTPITLRLFCAARWNVDPLTGAPLCQSLGVALPSGAAFFVPPPMDEEELHVWQNRGPMLEARLAQLWYSASLRKNTSFLLSSYVFDPEESGTGHWFVRLKTGQLSESAFEWLRHLLSLPDHELLQQCSTSPEFELPHIAREMRASYRWVLEQTGPMRIEGRRFFWKRKQGWVDEAADAPLVEYM